MKIAVCTCIYLENLYLREWVEHYINLGFDKIILFDTNLTRGEYPQSVIQDYIEQGYVDVINKRVEKTPDVFGRIQIDYHNECINRYKNEYDWIAFFDTDEFLEIVKYRNIHTIFEHMNYDEYEQVCVNWILYDSNENQMYYKNEKVQERFKDPISLNFKRHTVKSFVKTSVNSRFNNCSSASIHKMPGAKSCFPNKEPIYWDNDEEFEIDKLENTEMYVKHYMFKSFEEFLIRRLNTHLLLTDDRLLQYKMCKGWSDKHQQMYESFVKYKNS